MPLEFAKKWHGGRLDSKDHDFGGFDEGGGAFAGFEAHFAGGVGGDERGDLLFTDAEGDLGEEAVVFDGDDAADELIAAGDFAEGAAAFGDFATFERFGDEAVDFGFGDAMMAAGSFGGFEFAAVDPLFEGGIADTEDVCGFARGEETLHGITFDEYRQIYLLEQYGIRRLSERKRIVWGIENAFNKTAASESGPYHNQRFIVGGMPALQRSGRLQKAGPTTARI